MKLETVATENNEKDGWRGKRETMNWTLVLCCFTYTLSHVRQPHEVSFIGPILQRR